MRSTLELYDVHMTSARGLLFGFCLCFQQDFVDKNKDTNEAARALVILQDLTPTWIIFDFAK